MHAWYPELRILHICAVVASGALFVARALAVNLAGAGWPMRRRVRILAYGVDTTLLAAAVMLTTIIGQYPLVSAWLTAKLVLLVLYILLGYAALRGRTHAVRLICLAGAAATYGFIVTVARAHHPLGLLAGT